MPSTPLPQGLSSASPHPSPKQLDEAAQSPLGSFTSGSIPTNAQLESAHSPLAAHARGGLSSVGNNLFAPSASLGNQGLDDSSTGSNTGHRGTGTNSTGQGNVSNPFRQADSHAVPPSSLSNVSDPESSSAFSATHHPASPEPAKPVPPSTPLLPSPSAALLLSPMTSTASRPAKPNLLFSNASSPGGALPGSASKSQPPHDPLAPPPAVHALTPSQNLSDPTSSARTPANDIDHANNTRTNNSTMLEAPKAPDGQIPVLRPPDDTQSSSPEPAPATVKAFPPGLLPAALTPLPSAAGQLDSAPGHSPAVPGLTHAAPGLLPTASQQMPADPEQYQHAQGPNLAAPSPLLGIAPSALAGSPKTEIAPGDAQAQNTVVGDTHTSHVPLIVLGTLLGAAVAALLAGMSFLFWQLVLLKSLLLLFKKT